MTMLRYLSAHLVTVFLLCQLFIFPPPIYAAGSLALPTGDLVAPEINHRPITETLDAEDIKKIQATVTDNVGVKEVILFYRPLGASSFLRMRMTRDMSTNDAYFATPDNIPEPGMEYYIQATDYEGNTLLHGHSFSPLTIKVKSNDGTETLAATPEASIQIAEESSGGISKWVWIGLGVLAVGALAASSSDSDDTPPPASNNDTGGTIIITGPGL